MRRSQRIFESIKKFLHIQVEEKNNLSINRCEETEVQFYFIMRGNNDYYKRILLYFNSKLIGILKFDNDLFLSFDEELGNLTLHRLSSYLEEEIKHKYKYKKNQWSRINLIGDKLPLNMNEHQIRRRRIYNFNLLKTLAMQCPELFIDKNGNKKYVSDREIFRKFLELEKEIIKENKNNHDFDLEILV